MRIVLVFEFETTIELQQTALLFQVQFEVYETEKMCSIQINDDSVFEGTESFSVELTMPTDALLGKAPFKCSMAEVLTAHQ